MTIYLDTETTGLSPSAGARVVQVALLRDDGAVLLDTLVNPLKPIPRVASEIHGITDAMVRNAPSWQEIEPEVFDLVRGAEVVIYNAPFDTKFFGPGLAQSAERIVDALPLYGRFVGEKYPGKGFYRKHKLTDAAAAIGYMPPGSAHNALTDCFMLKAVWQHIRDTEEVLRRLSCKNAGVSEKTKPVKRLRPAANEKQALMQLTGLSAAGKDCHLGRHCPASSQPHKKTRTSSCRPKTIEIKGGVLDLWPHSGKDKEAAPTEGTA